MRRAKQGTVSQWRILLHNAPPLIDDTLDKYLALISKGDKSHTRATKQIRRTQSTLSRAEIFFFVVICLNNFSLEFSLAFHAGRSPCDRWRTGWEMWTPLWNNAVEGSRNIKACVPEGLTYQREEKKNPPSSAVIWLAGVQRWMTFHLDFNLFSSSLWKRLYTWEKSRPIDIVLISVRAGMEQAASPPSQTRGDPRE